MIRIPNLKQMIKENRNDIKKKSKPPSTSTLAESLKILEEIR